MDLESLPLPGTSSPAGSSLCPCACPFCCRPPSPPWRRSMKRRLEAGHGTAGEVAAARVEVECEVAALREAIASQQETIQELCEELDEERNAAASAASEAMSMILRLQREKAEAQMEARQFQRFAEEKMDHDQQELLELEDLLFERDEAVQSLTFQLEAYRHCLLSYGVDPDAVDVAAASCGGAANDEPGTPQFDDIPTFEYPPLNCTPPSDVEHEEERYDEAADLEKYVSGETRHAKDDLENLEQRMCQLETISAASSLLEKGVVEEPSQPSDHFRGSSAHSYDSFPGVNLQEPTKGEESTDTVDRPLDDDDGGGVDDMSDRVYTIDAVHRPFPTAGASEHCVDRPKDEKGKWDMDGGAEGGSSDIKNLYMRLQALEADRESMKRAILSMRTEKAQLVLLREIAQQLYKEVAPERRIVKKKSPTTGFSIIAMLKWIMSFIVCRKKVSRTKYTFGSSNNVGLLLLLDNSPQISNWRCIARTQG